MCFVLFVCLFLSIGQTLQKLTLVPYIFKSPWKLS
jgi:hypothetical protein